MIYSQNKVNKLYFFGLKSFSRELFQATVCRDNCPTNPSLDTFSTASIAVEVMPSELNLHTKLSRPSAWTRHSSWLIYWTAKSHRTNERSQYTPRRRNERHWCDNKWTRYLINCSCSLSCVTLVDMGLRHELHWRIVSSNNTIWFPSISIRHFQMKFFSDICEKDVSVNRLGGF